MHGLDRRREGRRDPIKATLTSIDARQFARHVARRDRAPPGEWCRTSRSPTGPTSTRTTRRTTSARSIAADWGFPDRDYYIKTDPSSDSLRKAYVEHITKMLTLVGDNATTARANATQDPAPRDGAGEGAARARGASRSGGHRSSDDARQVSRADAEHRLDGVPPRRRTHRTARQGERRRTELLQAARTSSSRRRQSKIGAPTSAITRSATRRRGSAARSSQENFEFNRRFSGAKSLLPRWKRCLQATDGLIGEALGQAYVAKTFPPAARTRAKALIDDIRASFGDRVRKLDWMSEATKKQALNKLALMREKVGYPDTWRDYSKLETSRRSIRRQRVAGERVRVEADGQSARARTSTSPNGG